MDYSGIIQNNLNSLTYFLPEIILAGLVCLLVISDLLLKKDKSPYNAFIALAGLVVAFVAILQQYNLGNRSIFNDMLVVDPFSLYFKVVFLATAIVVIFLSFTSVELAGRPVGEYFTLIVALTLGMSLLASSTNLLTIYIAIEFVSIVSFVLAAYLKTRRRSSEAGLKYAIYGAFSSGLMLYGMSLLYGLTGSLNIYEIRNVLAGAASNELALLVSVILILAGFGYKIASVPFHFWAPDVYEGAPTPVTAFLSVGPKAAGFAVLIRFFNVALASGNGNGITEWTFVSSIDWGQILAVVAAATMTLGNLVAIVQKNMKRLLAYSSIAHAGYILMGTVLLSEQGIYASMFYLFIYYLMNLGAFLIVMIFHDVIGSENIEDYKGLGYRAPIPALALGVFLFALTGIPPTSGFIGKFYLFAAVVKAGPSFYWLAVVGIINSVISLYYYARVLKAMFIEKLEKETKETTALRISPFYIVLIVILVVPTLVLGIYWAPLADFANYSVDFLRAL